MSESLTIDFRQPVPLFPLPSCVLLPWATVPLHIFEPRYRKMTSDALDSRGLIAMAMFEGDNWRKDYEGNPDIRPVVCVGYIVRHERLPDGRFNILLQGACRARVVRETPVKLYRQAFLEPLETTPPMEIDLADERERLECLLNDPMLQQLSSVAAVRNWVSREIPTAALIDLATMAVCEDSDQRYELLSESVTQVRAHWLERWLRTTRRTLSLAGKFEPPQTSDQINFN